MVAGASDRGRVTLLDEVRADLHARAIDDLVPGLRRGQLAEVDDVVEVAALAPDAAVAAIRLVDAREVFVPIVRDGRWRRAEPADAISMSAVSAQPPLTVDRTNPLPLVDAQRERAPEVDMTNDVRIIDDAVVVKWQLLREPGSLIGPRIAAHLSAAGFTDMPEPFATVTWHDDLLATFIGFLPDAQDGWEWMLDDVLRMLADGAPAPTWVAEVGTLTARMHAASATPTPVITRPVAQASLANLAGHYLALLGAPLDPQMAEAVLRWRPRFIEACEELASARDAEVMPIHRDLHPGQFLRWRDGIAICDFDGNPNLPADLQDLRGPTARDVAGILRGFDHVAIAAARRLDDERSLVRARTWARQARDEALAAYLATPDVPALDKAVLTALESLSPLHEAVYASRYLPRWRYVPLAVLDGGW